MKPLYCNILIMALFCSILAKAQDPVMRVINNLNGLPSNTVYNTLQDKKGFVWIAHDRGLCRYDGKTFKPYVNQSQNSRSLSNLMEDAQGNIWCQDFIGNFFFSQHDSLVLCREMPTNGAFRSATILGGRQLVNVTDSNLRSLNLATRQLQTIPLNDYLLPNFAVEQNLVYLLGEKHLYQYDGQRITILKTPVTPIKATHFIVKNGADFFQIQRSLTPYIVPVGQPGYKQPALPSGLFIQNITHTSNNEIWIATSMGAYCFDAKMQPLYNGHCFFKDKSISGVMVDAEKNYWFGTIGNGLLLVSEIDVRLFTNAGSITVLSTTPNKSELLAGSARNELLSFNTTQNKYQKILVGKTIHDAISIYQSDNNNIVYCADRTYFLKDNQLASEDNISVKSSVHIGGDYYIAAYTSGVCVLNFNKKVKQPVPKWLLQYATPEKGQPNVVCHLITGIRGRWVAYNPVDSTIYAATTKGLFYWNPHGFGSIKNGADDIFGTQIKIYNGKAYISSFSTGIFVVNKTAVEKHISVAEGLPSNTVYKFQKSGQRIWMISDELLQSYNEVDGTTQKFDYTDGLPRAELKDIAVQNGMVYVATTDGLAVFSDTQLHLNETRPRIEIGRISLSETGQPVERNTKLSYRENSIVVDFSVLAFRGDKNIKVAYSINGKPWQPLEKDARELNLPSLSPGNYIVQLRAFNEDGIASQKTAQCSFFIQAPFYKRLWFLLPLALLSAVVIYAFMQRRINRIRKTNNLLEQKLQLEQELQKSMLSSIKAQMNPHFIFNALNTIQSFIFSNNKNEANAYLGKFSHLMRTVLDMSNKENVTLDEEIKSLELYLELEKMRFEDKLEYVLSKAANVNAIQIRIPSMIIQPYIENAIKHGLLHKKDDRQLIIRFEMEGAAMLKVMVDDNGVGRKKSEEINARRKERFASFSTQANETRLSLLNTNRKQKIGITYIDKEDANHLPTGTTVVLRIPL